MSSIAVSAQQRHRKRGRCRYGAPCASPCKDLNFYYGDFRGLKDISLDFHDRQVTALIGPSGCGKSTLLRTFNRIYSLYPEQRADGQILLDGAERALDPSVDVNELRARVGMVFQKPTPFPMSIYDNIAFGIRLYEKLLAIASSTTGSRRPCARRALWDEVKDKLRQSGMGLSGGQQQRLCIARTIAQKPGGDPARRADLGARPDLDRQDRGADRAAALGIHHRDRHAQHAAGGPHLAVHGLHVSRRARGVRADDPKMFMNPVKKQTQDYITGRFG